MGCKDENTSDRTEAYETFFGVSKNGRDGHGISPVEIGLELSHRRGKLVATNGKDTTGESFCADRLKHSAV
jgi:hypothetical protein